MFKTDYENGPSVAGFKDFVASKSPHEGYNWSISAICACGQYSNAIGVENWSHDMAREVANSPWAELNRIAHGDGSATDWTFGKLKERLELV